MKKNLTCIVCPIGCSLMAEIEGGVVTEVHGNTCPRGKAYAESECTAPKRMLTTTVRGANGAMIPVKTESPIPKEKIRDAMKIIKNLRPLLHVSVGDVIMEDVCGSKVVATRTISLEEGENA